MYIVRNYAALMNLNPKDRINAVFTTIPFNKSYRYIGRLKWPNLKLLYRNNYRTQYQRTVAAEYPPDTHPYNNKYTYMPLGVSIHNVQYMHDFKNYY